MTYKLGITVEGRPKCRPGCIWADTKYHILLVLTYLYNRHIKAQIKERSNTKPKHGRPNIFLYQRNKSVRSSVERFFGWLKSFRRIQTRYERLASIYLGFIQLRNDTNEAFQMSSITVPTSARTPP